MLEAAVGRGDHGAVRSGEPVDKRSTRRGTIDDRRTTIRGPPQREMRFYLSPGADDFLWTIVQTLESISSASCATFVGECTPKDPGPGEIFPSITMF